MVTFHSSDGTDRFRVLGDTEAPFRLVDADLLVPPSPHAAFRFPYKFSPIKKA